ncbi:MAG: sugar ABC transporter permease [Caldilinea sp. CFX5]|nr:sugar ABC transporter permease [Caldilinea sp. CFX5]
MATAAITRPGRTVSRKASHEARVFWLCVAPWVIGFILFTLGPMLYSLYISFTKWGMLQPPQWIGLDNYVRAFSADPDFYHSLRITFFYTIFSIPLKLITALFLAILLNEATHGVGFFRTAFYMPAVVASVAAAVLWSWILNPRFGPVNGFLGLFGIEGPNWFGDPDYALWGLIMMSTWNVGGEMLIFLAGLKGIPKALYEASELDGANRLVRFFRITLPMLSTTIFFNFVMSVIGSFQAFDSAYVISGARAGTLGGPDQSTLLYMLLVYTNAFQNFNGMGYATALAWILFVIILILTLIILRSSDLWVYNEGERNKR